MLVDVPAKVICKILQRTLKRFHCSWRKGTKRVARCKEFCLECKSFKIARASLPLFHRKQNLFRPRETAPARRAPAARFLREEVFEVPDHAHRTRLIIQDDHGSSAQSAARLLHVAVIHGCIEMLLYKKVSRCSTRQRSSKAQALAHASCMVLKNFAHRRAHGKLPESWLLYFAADAVNLGTTIFGPAEVAEPFWPLAHDVMNIAKCFHVLHDGRLPP